MERKKLTQEQVKQLVREARERGERPDLNESDLNGADLSGADLSLADLTGAILTGAILIGTDLRRADLRDADLRDADLRDANLRGANLRGANLRGANLSWVNLTRTKLDNTNFSKAIIRDTSFIGVDLSQVEGLTDVNHQGPSIIDINTIYQSKDKIPREFLERTGVHPDIIRWQHSLHTRPTVFISYSSEDEREKDELLTHLRALEREDLITIWHDGLIGAGVDWKPATKQAIAKATIALLLITPNFLASDFIQDEEIPEFLKRRESDEKLVIFPIIAKHCAWKQLSWLADIQVRPKGGQPIWGKSQDIDAELASISEEIIEIVRNRWLR